MIGIFALITKKDIRVADAVIKDIVIDNNCELIFDYVKNENVVVVHNILNKFQKYYHPILIFLFNFFLTISIKVLTSSTFKTTTITP